MSTLTKLPSFLRQVIPLGWLVSLRVFAAGVLLFFLTACTAGSDSVDKLIGPINDEGNGETPTYSLDFDPNTWDFGKVLLTTTTPLTKTFDVKNQSGKTLFISKFEGSGAVTSMSITSETCTLMTGGIATGKDCQFTVSYLPATEARHEFNVTVKYGEVSGDEKQSAVVSVFGEGASPANLAISDGPTFDFGPVVATAVAEKTLTITNIGGYDANSIAGAGLAAPFDFKGGAFPGVGGTCTTDLASKATCTIVVTFNPPTTGPANDIIEITYFNGDANAQSDRPIEGTGATPAALAVSDGPVGYDFGTLPVGAALEKTFTITNSGGVSARSVSGSGLSSPFTFKGGAYPGTGGTCGAAIPGGNGTCTVVVRYAPTATGTQTGTMNIDYFDGLDPQQAQRLVQGTAVTPANIAISHGPTHNFGTLVIGNSAEQTFTLTNNGQYNASFVSGTGLAGAYAFKGGTYPGTGGNCGGALSPSATCDIVVTYIPTTAGPTSDTIEINYSNGVAASQATRNVQGIAVPPAVLAIAPTPDVIFGTRPVGSSTDMTVTVTNTGGTDAVSISAAALPAPFSFKGGTYPGTGGTCATSIMPAASCTITVTYAPLSTGNHAENLDLTYNDGVGSVHSIRSLKGTAVTPASLSINDGPIYDFGSKPIGSVSDHVFTVSNSGGFAAASVAGSGLAAPFSFKGGSYPGTGGTCGASLAGGANCTIVVSYAALSATTSTDTIDLTFNDGNTTQTSTRDLTATGVTPATLVLSNAPSYDFGPIAVNGSAEATLLVTNTGDYIATTMAGSGLADPFTFKGGNYPGTGGTCGTQLAGGANCSVVVVFAPTTLATLSDTLELAYFNGASAQQVTRDVQGVGTTPATLAVSNGPTFDFGALPFGASSTATLTVTNTGGVTASAMTGAGLSAPFTFLGGTYPGTGGTCAATLSASATCTVVLQFSPTSAGTFNGSMLLSYYNTVTNATTNRAVTGTGVNPANLAISSSPFYSFGTIAVGGIAEATLTISNGGQFIATTILGDGLAAPFAFKGGAFPGVGGTCSTSLNAGSNCTIVVTYNPGVTGLQTDDIEVSYFNGAGSNLATRTLSGTGAAPAQLSLDEGPAYDYGDVAMGAVREKTFVLSNGGGVGASAISGGGLAAPFAFKGGSFPGTGGTCGLTLPAGASCNLIVTFAPSTVAPFTDDIEIGYFNGAATQSTARTVLGNAVAPAQLSLTDAPLYNFGTIPVTGTAERTFTVTNSGSLSATAMNGQGLTAPFSFKGGSYPGTGGTCATTLTAGGSCTIVTTFNPTATGPFSNTVQVVYHNGVGNVQATRDLQGVGAPAGSLSISGAPTYDFGSWPQGATREATLTVTNTGGVPTTAMAGASLNLPFLWKGGGYPGTGGTCATDLPASGTCTVVIEFAPTTVATFNENLTLNYNDGLIAASSTRALTGTAVPPAQLAIDASPTYDYGTVPTGGARDHTFTVTNNGGFPASALAGAGLSAPYTFKGGSFPGGGTCAATLNVGASCTFIVTYAPTATGSQSGTIQVNYNNGVSAQTSTRGVIGQGAAPASLSLSHGPTLDYGTLPVGATADHAFTLTNSGGVPASSIVGTGLSAPFSFKGGTFPGTGGNCTANLAASAACTIVVTYAPTAPGTSNLDLTVNYDDGVVARTTLRAITGTAVPPGAISISESPTYNYGTVATGATKDHTFTLTNSGGYLVTSLAGSGLTAPYTYKGGSFPGTGGNCVTSLAAGATCTMVITYAPTTTGAHNATAAIGFFDGALNQTSNRAIQGTGAAPASLAISNGPFYDFGTRATGSVNEVTLTVTNSGGVPATSVASSGVNAPYRFKGGSYPGTGGNCLADIAAAGSCTLVIEYAPIATGSQIVTLDLAYGNGVTGVNTTREIRGVGAAPASIGISDGPQHDFGTLAAGGTADKTLTLTNSGGVPATAMSGGGLTAPFGFKGGGYPGTGGTCNATLNAGSTCTVVVSYNPTVAGSDSGAVSISYNDGVTTMSSSRNLVGVAVAPALLTVSNGATFDFGTYPATASIDQVLTITNSGSLAATSIVGGGLTAPFRYKGGAYPGTGGTCGTTINAAATCSIVVNFNPTVNGSFNSTVEVAYFDGAQARTSVRPLQGTAAPPAQLTITDGPTYNYGNVAQGGTRDKTFTVTNGGGVTATAMVGAGIAAPFTFKDGVYPGTGGTCATTLPATQTCTIVVNYNPTTVAVHNSTIEMNFHNGLIAAQATRAVTGTGVTPAILDLSDSPHVDFGTVATGGFLERTVTVTNNGNFSATALAGAGLDAPYTFKGGTYPGTGGSCLTTLNIGASCTIVVRFAPTGTGAQSDTIEISYNNGASVQTSTRDVQGIGAAPALIGITDAPFYDFGTLAVGGSKERIFTLTNTGGVPASSLGGSGLDAPFSFKGGGYPGTAGTCTTSLAAGASCTVIVVYAPSAVGNHSDGIDVTYSNGVSSVTESRTIQGTAVSPANINISNTPTYNFNTVAIGAVGEHTFTLTNTGSFQATSVTQSALSAPYAYKGGTYPGSGGTCNATLNGGASCTVVVTFAPTATGVQNATMSFAYNDGAQAQNKSVGMTGTGATAANLTITNSPTYNYGTRATGSTLDQSFTITNTGGVSATSVSPSGLAAPFAFKGGSYPGAGGDCGASIIPAASCTIVVTYAPLTTGAHSVTLAMSYQNGVTTTVLNQGLNGTGAAPASVTISNATSFDFGTRAAGSVGEHTFVLTNSGGVPASSIAGSGLDAPFAFKGGSFPGTGGTCSGSIPAATTCTAVVQFAPSAAGAFSDTFDFSYNDGVTTQTTNRDMTGTGVSPAQLSLSHGTGLNFGAVPVTGSADLILTVTNTGGFVANSINVTGVSAPFSFKGGSFPGSGGNCGTSLGVGNNCQISLTFAPTALGAFNGTLDVAYDNGVTAVSSTRAMQGTGAPPATLTISETGTYNFGVLANNSSAERTFTITNTGGVNATAMGGAALSAPYSFKGGTYPGTAGTCAATLGATLTCTVVVVYAPTTIAVHNANLTMNYNDGLAAQSTTRPLTGESVAPASLTLSDTPSYDYGTIAIGATRDHTFTVTNAGSFVATSIGGSGLSAPFTFKGTNTFPGTGGTCTASLNPGATCTVVVTWAPTATGAQSATMAVNYFSGSGNLSSTVGVQGVGANVALISMTDGPLFDFGDRATGSSTDKSITLTNTGGVAATSLTGGGLASPFTFKGGTFPGSGGTCTGGVLAAGASCNIIVTYAPTANGTLNDTIEIDYNNGLNAHQVTRDIRGTGQPPAALTITDLPTYDFGPVATTGFKDKVFTITNNGGLTATSLNGTGLSLPFKFKGAAGTFPGTGGTCVTTLAPAASCTIVVSFLPTVDGPASSTVNLTYNDGATSQPLNLGVQGTGAPPAVLAISGTGTFNFGTVANGGLKDQSFTVSNTGGVEATVVAGVGLSAPYGFKGGTYPGTGGTCSNTIAVAGSCTVVVTYSPTNIATHTSNLQMDYFDGLVSQNTVRPLTGTAVAPALLGISGANPVSFGTIAIGNSADLSFTITNNGSFASSAMSGAGLAAPFDFKGGAYPGTGGNCAASLSVGASCTVVVTFTPTGTGVNNSTLQINYNDGAGAVNSQRTVTGTGTTPANITISEDPFYNFGAVANGSVNLRTFVLTNIGGVPAASLGGGGLALPFSFEGGPFPGTTGNCGTTLAPGATCSVVVSYAPTVNGPVSDFIDITYHNTVSSQSISREVRGSSTAPALLAISGSGTYNFGPKANGSVTDATFTVTNSGQFVASGVAVSAFATSYSFKGGSFPGSGGTCGLTIAPAASCTMVLTFAPLTSGTWNANLDIAYNNGVSTINVVRPLTGTSTPPAVLTISGTDPVDFGTRAVGATSEVTFTLSNTGSYDASAVNETGLTAPFGYKGGAFPGTGGTCTTTIAASTNCTVVMLFSPVGTGLATRTMTYAYNNGVSTQTVSRDVQGTGVAPALIVLNPTPSFDFGAVANGSINDKIVVLTNTGGLAASTLSGAGLSAPITFKDGTFPGTGGNCGTSLPAGASCNVVVTYAPTVTGSMSETLNVTYNNGVSGQTSSLAFTGSSTPPASLSISGSGTYNFGPKANGSVTDATFTVTNNGQFLASTIAVSSFATSYAFKGGSYPGSGGTCGLTLAPAASCTMVLSFAPVSSGTWNANLDIAYNNGVATVNVVRPLTGTSTPPAVLTISGTNPVDFGTRAVGATSEVTFTLSNTGGYDATSVNETGLSAPFGYKGGSFPGTGGTCATTIAASTNCTVVMLFSPVGTGLATRTMTFAYNNGVSTQTSSRDVQGTGVAPALVVLNPTPSFDFGAVANGSVNDKIVVLTNTGGLAATSLTGVGLSAPITFKDGTFPGTGGNCGTSLPAGASCNVVVTYAPTVTASMSATLNVTYDNGVSGQMSSLAFTGSSTAPALLTISGSGTYNFGPKANGSVTDATFTISNTGAFAASTISTAAFATHYNFKGSVYPGSGGTCGITLAPSATCTIVLSFSPTATGTHNSALDITYNNGVSSQNVVRNLTGTSSPPAVLTISDSNPYDFGTVAVGASADHNFTITNTGGYDASSMAEVALAAPFYYKGGTYPGVGGNCGTLLSATASCTIVVTYTPTATGTQNGTLQMSFNNGVTTVSTSRTVTGVGVAPALLTITPAGTWDYGAVANGSVNDKSFTLTNTGGLTATGISGGGLVAPITFKGGGFPGTGGTCSGGTLAAGANCTFVVTYAPLSSGPMADTIEVAYHNGVELKQVTRDAIGSSSAPAVLTISETGTFNFGAKANGSVTDKTFTITNTGAFTASALTPTAFLAPYSFKGASYPGSGGTCSISLPGGQSCTVVVTFAPTVTGTHNSALVMSYNDGVQTLSETRNLTGTSTAPANLTISGTNPVDFGTVAVGASSDQTFTLQNTGGYDASSITEVGLAAPFAFKGGAYPGTGGNCSTPIAASTSCTIVVTYTPTGTGLQSDAIEMSYNNGVSTVVAVRNVQGTGVAPANIAISGANPLDFGTVATGGAKDMSVTLTNTGGLNATSLSGGGISAPFTFKGGGFPGTGGTCTGGMLAAGANCTVIMTYAPIATGPLSGTLDITFNNGVSGQTVSRNVQGTGAPPATLTMSGSGTYDFGPVALTGSAETTFTITNGGGVAATTVSGAGLAAPFKFKGVSGYPGTGGTCGTTINPGANCTIVVQFNPTASSTDADAIEINYNDGATSQLLSRNLQGTGAPPATLTISGAGTYIFPTLARGGSAENTFTITNTGGVTATAVAPTSLTAPFSFKGGAYPGTAGTCNTSLAPGANCTVVIVYSPTNVATHNQNFVMNYNDGLTMQTQTRPLQGTALTPATLAITNGTYDFGTLATGASADMTLTVSNSGDFTANITGNSGLTAPFTYKNGAYPGTGGTCNTSLAVSASCTIVVTFAPTGTGSQSATATIDYFDGAVNQQAQRTLTGFGAAPAQIVISDPPSYNFGSVANGGVAERSFTISNTGGVPATSMGGSGLAAPFSFKGGTYPGTGGDCGTSLAASGTCTVVVRFQPTVTNSYSNNMSINYSNGVSGTNSIRAIEGTSADPAVLTISETGTYDYGTVANGASKDRSFTITNTGGVTATGMNVTGLAAPFGFKDGSSPGTGGNCSATLAPAATCTIVVSFSPTAINSFSGNIVMNYGTGLTTTNVTRPVQGIGAAPATLVLNLGPTYNFGTVARGSVNEVTFQLTNTGGAQAVGIGGAVLLAPYAYKGGSFPGAGGNCTTTLNGSQSCNIVVTYTPSSNGTHNSALQVNYSNTITNLNTSVNLAGVAVNPASLSLDGGNPYDFGTRVTTSVTEHTFTMTNNGAVAATNVTGAALPTHYAYKGGSFPGTGGSCTSGGSVNPAGTCTIVVNYSPTATGTHSGAMTINYNDGANSATATQNLTGVGSTAAQLTLSNDPSLDFGNVATGASFERTLTVTNSGGVAATSIGGSGISAPYTFKGGTFPGTGGSCTTSLGVGLSCTVVMVFSPTITGAQPATVDITYNNGLIATSSSRNLTGAGVGPALLAITPGGTADFGSRVTGSTFDITFTLTNSGGVTATSISPATLAAPFGYVGGGFPGGGTCGTSLVSGGACTFTVRFAPLTVGVQPGTATLNYFDAANNQSVSKSLTGTGTAPTAPTLARITPVAARATASSVVIRATGVAANDVVHLYTDSLCATSLVNGTVLTGNTEIDLTTSIGSDGTYTFYAKRINSVGTPSACSTATTVQYTRDTTPPVFYGFANQSPARVVHWNATPVLRFSGTFVGDTVKVYTDNTCSGAVFANYTNQTTTAGTVDLTLPLIPSSNVKYFFYAQAEDDLGNKASCLQIDPINYLGVASRYYVVDTTDVIVGFDTFYQVATEGAASISISATMQGTAKAYPFRLYFKTVGTAVEGTHTSGITPTGWITFAEGTTTSSFTFSAPDNGLDETDTYLDFAAYDTSFEYVHAAGNIYHRVLIRDNDGSTGQPVALPSGYGAGRFNACYVGNDSKLRCAGRGLHGVVGNGSFSEQENYVVVDSANNYKAVSTGSYHACAITNGGSDPSGTVKCWGNGGNYRTGLNVTTNYNQPQVLTTTNAGGAMAAGFKEIGAGEAFSCAIDGADKLWCWGLNSSNQSDPFNGGGNIIRPKILDSGNTYKKLSVGNNHACAIRLATGYPVCWGSNGNGRTGRNTATGNTTNMNTLENVVYIDISAGESHSCGVTSAGIMKCWGNNGNGRTGTANDNAPALADGSVVYTSVSAGNATTCGVTSNNDLRCTGVGSNGQLLDRLTTDNSNIFVVVQSGTKFTGVQVGYNQTWAYLQAGGVVFGGWEKYYGLSGDGKPVTRKFESTPYDYGNTFMALDTGMPQRSTCAISSNKKLRCTGFGNNQGNFGINSLPDMAGYIWIDVANDYKAVASTIDAMCALRDNGKIFCSGNANSNGVGANRRVMSAVDAATTYVSLAGSYRSFCGITTTGQVKCWGSNSNGQLGDGSTTNRTVPTATTDGTAYASVALGSAHTCGITTGGTLKCWGAQNNGRLGNNATGAANITNPTAVSGGGTWLKVAAGGAHSCAIKNDNKMYCFGEGTYGRLGDNNTGGHNVGVPTQVTDAVNDYKEVSASDQAVCGINTTGDMYCFGNWEDGVAGSVDTAAGVPTAVDAGIKFQKVNLGFQSACGMVETTGDVRCWGNNWYNTFGDFERSWIPEALLAPL